MIGLHLMAKQLALLRADEALGREWYSGELRESWLVWPRDDLLVHGSGPSAQYYHIIDRLSAGKSP